MNPTTDPNLIEAISKVTKAINTSNLTLMLLILGLTIIIYTETRCRRKP